VSNDEAPDVIPGILRHDVREQRDDAGVVPARSTREAEEVAAVVFIASSSRLRVTAQSIGLATM